MHSLAHYSTLKRSEEFEQALASDIATVADNISDINTVGQAIAEVKSVADNLTDVSTVADNVSDVNTVAGISSDVSQVAGISNAVQTVSSHDSEVTLVSDNMASVMATASNISNVNAVAGNATNINTVAGISSDVTTVSTNATAVTTAATNIAAIIAAPTAAQNAATSATNAQKWAEGTDSDVTPLGGTHSSKGWANVAKQYAESLGTALKYKGSVATYSALPSTGQEIGDMWNVLDTGKNYAWTGTEWDDLSGVVDLSAYRTAAQQDLIDATKQDTLVSGTNIKTINSNSLLGSGNIVIESGGGNGKSIGEVYYSQSSSASDNPGETIANADEVYPDFYDWVADHSALQVSAADYETALSTYGECPKYVIDTVNKTIRLPKLTNYVKMANTTDGITQSGAGLPNITGAFATGDGTYAVGAFSNTGTQSGNTTAGGAKDQEISFDASQSSSIYGNSNTVTPAHTTLYPWVCAYNAAVPASTAQAAEFQTALTGKLDVEFGNLSNAGKALVGSLALPSDTTIQLSIASDYKYTAAADGYVTAYTTAGIQMFVFLENDISKRTIEVYQQAPSSSSNCRGFIPVRQGQNFYVSFGGIPGGSVSTILFTYAKGSEPQN